MADRGRPWSPWRRRITRGISFLGLTVAVVGPFGLVAVGVENDRPLLAATGLVLGAVVVAIVLRRRPGPPR